ncbi:MAG: hypothetical protein KAS01_01410 [Candidatus Pacebacteria bacterium]|nr:hypothetical protein [Candidatus Paceibacterota bacterium]
MKIILDFDDTIFDTFQVMQEFRKIFNRLGFTDDEFWSAYQQCKKDINDFNPDIFLDTIERARSYDKKKAKEGMQNLTERFSDFIFSDFFCFLNIAKKEELILLSYGLSDFQKNKIEKSGIIPYFSEIIITSRDKAEDVEEIQNKYKEKLVFIEDKAESIDSVKKKLPEVTTMKIIRPQGGHIEKKSELTNYIIQDLFRLEDIINNLRD